MRLLWDRLEWAHKYGYLIFYVDETHRILRLYNFLFSSISSKKRMQFKNVGLDFEFLWRISKGSSKFKLALLEGERLPSGLGGRRGGPLCALGGWHTCWWWLQRDIERRGSERREKAWIGTQVFGRADPIFHCSQLSLVPTDQRIHRETHQKSYSSDVRPNPVGEWS